MIDNTIKYRLIGAGIMVLSAAVLLPLVLDGERPAELDRQVELPKAPEFVVQKIDPVQSLEELTVAPSRETNADDIQLIPVPQATDASKTVTKLIEKPTAKVAPTVSETKVSETKVSETKTSPQVASKPAERWTLQIATFKSQENAQRLVAKLKEANYDAYSITVNSLYKVYVGPEFKREVSEKAKEDIKKTFRLNGFVTKYSVN